MKMKRLTAILFFSIICIWNAYGQATSSDTVQQKIVIKTIDDNTMIGTIDKEDDMAIWLSTEKYGVVKIQKLDIVSQKDLKKGQLVNGQFWFENPNATRNLYGPTGYGLKKGEGYYQNFYLILNSVSYGITDNFTIGVGTVPFGINATGVSFLTVTPKLSFPIVKDKLNVGTGILYSRILGSDAGIAYGVLTYGSRDNNITVGTGYGFFRYNDLFSTGQASFEFANRPILTISGTTRLSKRMSLVTENWFVPSGDDNYQGVFTLSFRYILDKVSIDLGLINTLDGFQYIIGLPVVGAVIPFEIKGTQKKK